ncbi:ligase-associated DNA damage response endonuclease PdeM [Roseicyclus persicicus]|uniref:Ligase-associated DNA damage response endonuclease PdeM n=1 Tax=Roseicyclus persicicus TaxID=2650661 RepID=A0A7X6GXF6_9RHOB|nr:ligase-associated DNA damage response endonuclease PdeM [Roseibacterium persicicum]NKX44180.1 ligase-associated DNA damage response endonuclease PdeM [Roseibacterium persicicum]
MNALPFPFRGETLHALPSGGLHWPARRLLCVADLHLGKSDRMARRGGPMLPPYESLDTLDRLADDIAATGPSEVVCLGDSFDDLAAGRDLAGPVRARIAALMAGRRWIWVLGNHDPGPVDLGGTHLAEYRAGPLVFRHIAEPGAAGEVSGHYHPKARVTLRGRSLSRRCLLVDSARLILPAYGTYTGGLSCDRPELATLMEAGAEAILLGPQPVRLPMPR